MSEQRKWPRIACLERCLIEPCAHGSTAIRSRVVNFSHGGLQIESDYPLRTGEPVRIRFDSRLDEPKLARMARGIGMVSWCSRQEGNFSALYGAGIEIPEEKIRF